MFPWPVATFRACWVPPAPEKLRTVVKDFGNMPEPSASSFGGPQKVQSTMGTLAFCQSTGFSHTPEGGAGQCNVLQALRGYPDLPLDTRVMSLPATTGGRVSRNAVRRNPTTCGGQRRATVAARRMCRPLTRFRHPAPPKRRISDGGGPREKTLVLRVFGTCGAPAQTSCFDFRASLASTGCRLYAEPCCDLGNPR
jgi:hypothetical protein